MADPIELYLDRHGPSLSSEVAQHLVNIHSLNEPAARKRVSRVAGDVRRLQGVTFPHKARLLYLQSQFGSQLYWSRLVDALLETRSAYGYAIAALQQRDGLVPERYFPIVCGAPLRQQKHLSPETIFLRLSQAGLLTRIPVRGVGDCIVLTRDAERYEARADLTRARLISEEMLLLALRDWLRKMSFVSYEKVATRTSTGPLPQVGTLVWDLSGPSYLAPLVRPKASGGVRNGFVACDVHLGEPMTARGVSPFIRKCTALRGLRNVGATLEMLVADRFEADAFQALKQQGIVPATPTNLFGDEVAEGLRQLTSVMESAAGSVIDSDAFDDLFRKLGKIEGAANQLRGTLFEFLAAELARRLNGGEIWMNRKFRPQGQGQGEAEADVVAVRPHQEITVLECKGYSPRATIPDGLVDRWLDHNVPTCFRAISEHPDWRNLPVRFEFWTTAPLSAAAMSRLEHRRATLNPNRYAIALRGPGELHAMCRRTNDPSLIMAFEKHFLKVEDMHRRSRGHDEADDDLAW
jgi:hypothetical protein